MQTNYEMVREWHEKFGAFVGDKPSLNAPVTLHGLRVSLIREEVKEFEEALAKDDLVEVADALADLLYVTYGAGVTYGLDMDAVFAEVQRSNMSKLGRDGKPILREDGKILKGPDFFLPDIVSVLRDQGADL